MDLITVNCNCISGNTNLLLNSKNKNGTCFVLLFDYQILNDILCIKITFDQVVVFLAIGFLFELLSWDFSMETVGLG